MLFFFFFKQKTAYEMRISDWSSDVCSSDLARARRVRDRLAGRRARRGRTLGAGGRGRVDPRQSRPPDSPDHASRASYPRRAGGRCAVVARYRADRKSVVSGKSVSVRVDLGGPRLLKKKTNHKL